MFNESYLEEQRKIVASYMNDNFKINPNSLTDFKKFSDRSLYSIISIKLWKEKLESNNAVPEGTDQYIDEIISDLNQVIVMGILGFKIPSFIMMRRSLENIFGFYYYKDHPIEFMKKEDEPEKKNFIGFYGLKAYIIEYPFHLKFGDINKNMLKILLKNVLDGVDKNYKELSNFVHGSSRKYFELKNYLDDIKPDNDVLKKLTEYICSISSIINTLNILFFFDYYKDFREDEKSIIRLSIQEDSGFKRALTDIFGQI